MKYLRRFFTGILITWSLIAFTVMMFICAPVIILGNLINNRFGFLLMSCAEKLWAIGFMTLCGVFIFRHNKKSVGKEKAYIFVSNHNSYLDATGIGWSIPRPFKPLGKIEMTKVPLFGYLYKHAVVVIDRKSPESRSESVKKLKQVLKRGMSILLFPEGTMNRDLNVPLEKFYDGAFRIGIQTQTPIAPMVIVNARTLLPRNNPLDHFRPGILHVYFIDPVQTKGLTLDDVPMLRDKVHGLMETKIKEKQKILIKIKQ
ncbi:MAG: 1-acyl-sn-glycerol-3-phosphate acyltransferase [Sphingobacteriales bacterium]|jgi:1-acyl-sn-glycerol-3-phosphate acyltransferase